MPRALIHMEGSSVGATAQPEAEGSESSGPHHGEFRGFLSAAAGPRHLSVPVPTLGPCVTMKLLPAVLLPAVIVVAACRTVSESGATEAPRVPAVMDANGNGVEDALDIMDGTSFDENMNGVPDEVED